MIPDSLSTMETFNSIHFTSRHPSQPATFHPFTRLPTELRLQIWQLSILRTRLVTAMVLRGSRGTGDASGGYRRKNHLGNVISGDHYLLQIPQERRNDSLLGTCCEARRVALAFFRVRIPLQPWRPYGPRLYLNPEYDYLYIYSGTVANESLIGLLNDLRAFDPQSKGLLHLVCPPLNLANEVEEQFPISHETLSPAQTTSFRESLLGLETLWIIIHMPSPYRQPDGGPSVLQRSLPVMARGGTFEILEPDPRLSEKHCIGKDWIPVNGQSMRHKWQSWETELGVGPIGNEPSKCPRKISIVLCNKDFDHEEKPTLQQDNGAESEGDPIPPVAGFWIMPVDAIDRYGQFSSGFAVTILDFDKIRVSLGVFEL